jgi:hypothetical protein
MNANRDLLEEVRVALAEVVEKLERSGAPSGIAAHVELALTRLEAFVAIGAKWDEGNGTT